MPAKMSSVGGKVIIITGASSGIGAATAIHLGSLGAKLAISGRNEVNLKKTKENCISNGSKETDILVVVADVTVKKDLERLVENTKETFGKIDVLINNAGLSAKDNTINAPIETYDKIMDVNLRSIIVLSKLCIPYLIETKGSIVNVSSLAGQRAVPKVLYYCLSKAALDQLTKCLALELASKGVRVNSVNPAVIKTDFFLKNEHDTEEEVDEFLEHCKQTHPLGRVGEPEEIAKAIEFLAGDQASFTTGQCLLIDGGRSLATPR